MKLPFPYRTAGMLFLHDTHQKATLFLMFPVMFGTMAVIALARVLAARLPLPLWLAALLAAFFAVVVSLHYLTGYLSPLLWKCVRVGLVRKPDMVKLYGVVCWLAGCEENWQCPHCGCDLRPMFSGHDMSTPPPERCPECGAILSEEADGPRDGSL